MPRQTLILALLLELIIPVSMCAQPGLSIVEGPVYMMPCPDPCAVIHAAFPKPLKTNQYTSSTIPYAPNTFTGTNLPLGDDQFSGAIPIGFDFCFFENTYSQCYIADNGVLTFKAAYANASCNNNTQQTLPYFNSTFPDNAIFFMYMDVDPTLGGNVQYATLGVAPFRKFVVSFQNMRIFGITCSAQTSSYQLVLYETTNLIEVHVGSKVTCDSNPLLYANYASIGVQNAGATTAFTVPGKHAAIFTMNNQAVRIAPSGAPNYSMRWKNYLSQVIATQVDSIVFCPPFLPYQKLYAEIDFYCPASTHKDSVVLNKPLPVIDSIHIMKPLCNSTNTGSITVSATSVNPPLQYAINNGPFGNANVFSGLPVGQYTVSVKDLNGCRKDSVIQVLAQINLLVIADSVVHPICPDSNGKIVVHVANGSPPYNINWSNGASGTTASGLAAGTYIITVSDANGCTTAVNIILVNDSIPVVNPAITKPVCHDSSGSITVNVTGGVPPYQYLWSTGSISATASNLAAGFYTVNVTDAHGCVSAPMIQLVDTLDMLTFPFVNAHTHCGLNNGSAYVLNTSGMAPFTYSWMPGGQTTYMATGLAPGTYTCITTDANQCSRIDTITINPSLAIVNQISKANANCDSSNGTIYLNSVLNSTGNVHALWNTGDTSWVVSGLAPGSYVIQTTDSLGCKDKDTIVIGNDGKPHLQILSYTPPLCFGDSTGSVVLSGTAGTSPYKYSLDGVTFSSIAQLNHIAGGTYTIYITDANSCPKDTLVSFTQPAELITQYQSGRVVCFDDQTASISWTIQGGFPPYLYSLNNGNFSPQSLYQHLGQGTYTLVVHDSNHCEKIELIDVEGPSKPLSIIVDKTDIPCFETNTGSLSVHFDGGWPGYQYSWANGATGLEWNQLGETHTSITVTDSLGCTVNRNVDVDQLLCCKAILPNAFSPNGDNKNDVLRVMPISAVESIKFLVFDRWGKEVFSTRQLTEAWDGTLHGVPCDVGVYFYYLEYSCSFQKEKIIMQGDVTLLR